MNFFLPNFDSFAGETRLDKSGQSLEQLILLNDFVHTQKREY